MRHVESEDYGVEVVLDMPNGMQLHADGEDATGTSYVRVCDPEGVEVMYWNAEEWGEAPEEVMGAIIGALCAIEAGDPERATPTGRRP